MATGGGGVESPGAVGGEQAGGVKMKYSDRLKTNVNYNARLKRNVLEIFLDKTDKEADIFAVDAESKARVFKTLGIDIVGEVEGHQVMSKG